MNQAKRLCYEEQEFDRREKSSEFDFQRDYLLPDKINDHEAVLEEEKSNFSAERNLSKTEKVLKSMDKSVSESTDDNLITLKSLESGLEENNSKTNENCTEKDNENTKKKDEEEEGSYEELICLVRQFYVEKPINPAALAHQNIETC